MKSLLQFTKEWLRKKIESDPDLPCEVGACPEPDGRFFVWRRTRNTREGISPVLVHNPRVGGPMEFVSEKHVLSPAEYGDTIATLVERYPPPTIINME